MTKKKNMVNVTKSTISVFTENKPGVLYRIANLFLRRKINIESLTVSEIKSQGQSRFTIVVKEDIELVKKIVKQLKRIIEVFDVYTHADEELIYKELAMLKLAIKNPEELKKVEDIAFQFHATITNREAGSVILQKVGSEEDIDFLRDVLEPLGIKEIVRSGRIALEKGKMTKNTTSERVNAMSRATAAIDVSIIKRIELMARGEHDVVSLAQGIPSFFTAPHIREAARSAMDTNLVDKYTAGYGITPLREAVAKKIKKENGLSFKPEEVVITHGGIEAMMSIFMAMLNVEDEIIVLTPDYASHLTQITIATHGGKPVFVPLNETTDGWVLNPERLEQSVTQRTKAILVCNPCNPTGKVYSKKELKQIADIALKHNLLIISDEMYEHFVFDNREHISIGSFPEVADRTISVFGVSKSYAMTGWRIGYIAADQKIMNEIFKIHDSLVTCPTAISQYAALSAITGPQDNVAEYKEAFIRRRKIVMDYLAKTDKLRYTVPQGSYYCFPSFAKPVEDVAMAVRILKEGRVAVVPGTPFGKGGENHIRISFGCSDEQLTEGMQRLIQFVNEKL